jgi:hypothetical protein
VFYLIDTSYEISGFHHGAVKAFALLGCYITLAGSNNYQSKPHNILNIMCFWLNAKVLVIQVKYIMQCITVDARFLQCIKTIIHDKTVGEN